MMRKFSLLTVQTAQKMKFYIKDFLSKYDQIRRKLRIWSHLIKKSLMESFIFCAASTWYRNGGRYQELIQGGLEGFILFICYLSP